jgi:hypothetical protein
VAINALLSLAVATLLVILYIFTLNHLRCEYVFQFPCTFDQVCFLISFIVNKEYLLHKCKPLKFLRLVCGPQMGSPARRLMSAWEEWVWSRWCRQEWWACSVTHLAYFLAFIMSSCSAVIEYRELGFLNIIQLFISSCISAFVS